MLRHASRRLAGSLLRREGLAAGLQLRGLKETTGIVGVPVDPDARNTLRSALHKVLEAVKVIPADAFYRQQVEATTQHRLKAVDSTVTDEEVEAQLEAQLESLVLQCEDELSLIPQMAEWAPWDVPPDHKVDLLFEEDVKPPEVPSAAPPPPPPPPPPPKK